MKGQYFFKGVNLLFKSFDSFVDFMPLIVLQIKVNFKKLQYITKTEKNEKSSFQGNKTSRIQSNFFSVMLASLYVFFINYFSVYSFFFFIRFYRHK